MERKENKASKEVLCGPWDSEHLVPRVLVARNPLLKSCFPPSKPKKLLSLATENLLPWLAETSAITRWDLRPALNALRMSTVLLQCWLEQNRTNYSPKAPQSGRTVGSGWRSLKGPFQLCSAPLFDTFCDHVLLCLELRATHISGKCSGLELHPITNSFWQR